MSFKQKIDYKEGCLAFLERFIDDWPQEEVLYNGTPTDIALITYTTKSELYHIKKIAQKQLSLIHKKAKDTPEETFQSYIEKLAKLLDYALYPLVAGPTIHSPLIFCKEAYQNEIFEYGYWEDFSVILFSHASEAFGIPQSPTDLTALK